MHRNYLRKDIRMTSVSEQTRTRLGQGHAAIRRPEDSA